MKTRTKDFRIFGDRIPSKHHRPADSIKSHLIRPNPGIKNKITKRTHLPLCSSIPLSTAWDYSSPSLLPKRTHLVATKPWWRRPCPSHSAFRPPSQPRSCPIASHSGLIGPFRAKQYGGDGAHMSFRALPQSTVATDLLTTDH